MTRRISFLIAIYTILLLIAASDAFAFDAFITRKNRHYIVYKNALYDVTDFCNKEFHCTDEQIDKMIDHVLGKKK